MGSQGRAGAVRCGISTPMLIGYLRGRAADIDGLALQRQALAEAKCGQVIEDLAAGRRQGQPKLLRLLAGLQVDDVLVVPRMGTLGRSMAEVVRRVQYVAAAGADLRSLEEEIDTTTEAGRAAVEVIGGLAQLGRSEVRKPPGAGSEVKHTRGHKPGRKHGQLATERMSFAQLLSINRSLHQTLLPCCSCCGSIPGSVAGLED